MQTLMLCLGNLWYQSLLKKKIDNWYDFWLRMELAMAVKISILLENICQVIYHSETSSYTPGVTKLKQCSSIFPLISLEPHYKLCGKRINRRKRNIF